MDALRRFLEGDEIEVVVCDPAYLCTPLAADKGNNLFAIGELLRSVNDVCHECGCTLIIAHHFPKSRLRYEPPELADVAWSGWAEWARQWLLLNRREPYDPDGDGEHLLWFAAGGSAGHSGLWGLDIIEGKRTDPGGRRWDVTIRAAKDVRVERTSSKQADRLRDKQAKFDADCELARRKLAFVFPEGLTKSRLRDQCGFNTPQTGRVLEALLEAEEIQSCDVQVSNQKKKHGGYRLTNECANEMKGDSDDKQKRLL